MSSLRSARSRGCTSFIRPIAVGVVITIGITLVMVCIVSIVFSLLECVVKNAIDPISLASVALGCFVGSYICARSVGEKGVLAGAVIGIIIFLLILIISCFESDFKIKGIVIYKFIILIISGCCGGYLGRNGRYCGRRKR